jgi:hypothetical protein
MRGTCTPPVGNPTEVVSMDPVEQASPESQPSEVNVVSIDDLARIRRWLSTHHAQPPQGAGAPAGEGARGWALARDGEGRERRG